MALFDYFFFCFALPFEDFITSSTVGNCSGSGFLFIQIVFSNDRRGLFFNTAFMVIASSPKSAGMISSLPENLHAEAEN
jgi:hypothetical protein